MLKVFVSLSVLLIGSFLFGAEPPEDELKIIESVEQVIQSKIVWPGYDLKSDPVVITFGNSHVYAFQLNSRHPAWTRLKVGTSEVQYSEKDHWNFLSAPMMADFAIEGKSAFVFQIDLMKKDGIKPFQVFVHERFHRHQFQNFVNTLTAPTQYLDHLNIENLALIQLEEKILSDYFQSKDKEKLKDFLAVNTLRRSLIRKESVLHELDQQRMEGLADYVSFKVYDEERLDPDFKGSEHLKELMVTYLKSDSVSEKAMKWRHYGVGAALGYALDDLNVPNWKTAVQEKGAYQIQLLERSLKLTRADIEKRAQEAKEAYDYPFLLADTKDKIKEYERQLKTMVKDFDSQSGVAITVGQVPNSGQTGGGTTQGLKYMADGSTVSVGDDSFAASLDNVWKLRLKEQAYVFQSKEGEKTFKVEENLKIYLDGKAFQVKELLKERKDLAFKTIAWEGKKTAFSCENREGNIAVKGNKLIVRFDTKF